MANSSECVELPTSPSSATMSPLAPMAAKCLTVCQAGGNPAAGLVMGQAHFVGAAMSGAVQPSGRGPLTVRWRSPPSSTMARSAISAGSGLPCQPSRSSISENPRPFRVRARSR